MNYHIKASSISKRDAVVHVKQSNIEFGTTSASAKELANPAELFLSSIAACILKNVERFSSLLRFTYTKTDIVVTGGRLEHPPRMDNINYTLTIYSNDKNLNTTLLHKNIQNHGTIYNTVALACSITGTISKVGDV